jgi:hypothetical protein
MKRQLGAFDTIWVKEKGKLVSRNSTAADVTDTFG